MAGATRAGSGRRISTSRPASSPYATSSTRCSPSASTVAAWTLENALELLSKESGTAFDPACVEALERILARERQDAARAAAA